jgi:hypothetical protein
VDKSNKKIRYKSSKRKKLSKYKIYNNISHGNNQVCLTLHKILFPLSIFPNCSDFHNCNFNFKLVRASLTWFILWEHHYFFSLSDRRKRLNCRKEIRNCFNLCVWRILKKLNIKINDILEIKLFSFLFFYLFLI